MATNYPGSLDTSTEQPSPTASTEMDDAGFEHDVVHTNHSGAIIALETKLVLVILTPLAEPFLLVLAQALLRGTPRLRSMAFRLRALLSCGRGRRLLPAG